MNLKAKDLMIGDWVRYTTPIKVESITKKKIGYHIKPNESNMHYVRLGEIQPIPLTDVIMSKNGFKDEGGCTILWFKGRCLEYCYGEHSLTLWQRSIDGYLNHAAVKITIIRIPCFYVHELQHALRMCNIDKEIEL